MIDLTVRLRVNWTSQGRPDDDQLSQYRGTASFRLGTGYIYGIKEPECGHPCPCSECDGNITKRHWAFKVKTAHHVVYDTEEAKKTKVDLFYDEATSRKGCKMASVRGVEVAWSDSDMDFCEMLCVTHDELLGKQIMSAWRCLDDSKVNPLYALDLTLMPSFGGDVVSALIVSHPHGQPKKITVGKLRYQDKCKDGSVIEYDAPTCPGSSGAPVFMFDPELEEKRCLWVYASVHSGGFANITPEAKRQENFFRKFIQRVKGRNTKPKPKLDQLNYGNDRFGIWRNYFYPTKIDV
ncbi:hypothetical protein ElyMa_003376300 [Elysia marginata]|uniref:Peptidase S1 domain-containing protein n=1 Tax=Elysia marginata TaxID=1093978 RepID=A0AAV4JKY5_9GAST|nr:hypothetical protein ElyMa_003376300 [Elysia marginata]